MSTCCQNPVMRIEKIIENKKKNVPNYEGLHRKQQINFESSPYIIAPDDMTKVLEDVNILPPAPPSGATPPVVLPNSPTIKVPANPLLPPEYQEVLTYNDIQYANGFYRTQIGKYVKIESLLGSNNVVDYYGHLIGVGVNYVLLQDACSKNIYTLDFWSIKTMYIYYDQNDVKRIMNCTPK